MRFLILSLTILFTLTGCSSDYSEKKQSTTLPEIKSQVHGYSEIISCTVNTPEKPTEFYSVSILKKDNSDKYILVSAFFYLERDIGGGYSLSQKQEQMIDVLIKKDEASNTLTTYSYLEMRFMNNYKIVTEYNEKSKILSIYNNEVLNVLDCSNGKYITHN